MRLKVVSDGTTHGTKVSDATSGELLGRVQSIDVHVDVRHHLTSATIKTVETELVFEADFFKREALLKSFAIFLQELKHWNVGGSYPTPDQIDLLVNEYLTAHIDPED